MSLTQHELVRHLGISRGTLHRVLTNSPLVKEATRTRVLGELEKLHYTPNAIAQGLKTRRTKSIGIIGPAALKMANIDKINSLHKSARDCGYSAIIGYSNGSAEEDSNCIRDLRSRMVDGFVALGRGLPESVQHYRALVESGIPLVTLYPVSEFETDCVYVDTRKGFRELTEHLISLGHKKIGLLLDSSASQYTINREAGFREAMKKAKLPVNEDWVIHVAADGTPSAAMGSYERQLWQVSDYQLGLWGANLLLAKRDRPTAVVCFSDEFAIGALRACDLANTKVPEDLAMVGYDDKEPAKFARVPLTTMHQPDEQVGKEAIALLIKRIEQGVPKQKPLVRALPAQLVIRESCGSKVRK